MKRLPKWVFGALAFCLLVVAICAVLANGPDQSLELERVIVAENEPADLKMAFDKLEHWSKWHFDTNQVQSIIFTDHESIPHDQSLGKGILLKFFVAPPKKPWKKFDLYAEVIDYQPGKSIALKYKNDSKGLLHQYFDSIEWQVTLEPYQGDPERRGPNGRKITSQVRGKVWAHTKHWRPRMFSAMGNWVSRIIANQIFYPDLQKLAEFTPPDSKALNPQVFR